jgi:hypothetical protein
MKTPFLPYMAHFYILNLTSKLRYLKKVILSRLLFMNGNSNLCYIEAC